MRMNEMDGREGRKEVFLPRLVPDREPLIYRPPSFAFSSNFLTLSWMRAFPFFLLISFNAFLSSLDFMDGWMDERTNG